MDCYHRIRSWLGPNAFGLIWQCSLNLPHTSSPGLFWRLGTTAFTHIRPPCLRLYLVHVVVFILSTHVRPPQVC